LDALDEGKGGEGGEVKKNPEKINQKSKQKTAGKGRIVKGIRRSGGEAEGRGD